MCSQPLVLTREAEANCFHDGCVSSNKRSQVRAVVHRAASEIIHPHNQSIGVLAKSRESLRNQRRCLGRIDHNDVLGVGHIICTERTMNDEHTGNADNWRELSNLCRLAVAAHLRKSVVP